MHIREASPSDASAIEGLYKSFVLNPAIDVRADRIAEIRTESCSSAVHGEPMPTPFSCELASTGKRNEGS
jgi:hypothetical protein